MKLFNDWRPVSSSQLVAAIPELLSQIEAYLDKCDANARAKFQTTLDSLKAHPPKVEELRNKRRQAELEELARALAGEAKRLGEQNEVDLALSFLCAAHELVRGGASDSKPFSQMRHMITAALRVILARDVEAIRSGSSNAAKLRETMRGLVNGAWGQIPQPVAMAIDEMLLTELERTRKELENDKHLYETLIRNNVETVLGLEVSPRMEDVIDEWDREGERYSPSSIRAARRAHPRPKKLSELVPKATWDRISAAVSDGDTESLKKAIAEVEDDLEVNLQRRISSKPDFELPQSVLKYFKDPDRDFVEARMLLGQNDREALNLFRNLHNRKSNVSIAKDWYAYALARFGDLKMDKWDILELLEAAISSESFVLQRDWTVRWNLACVLRGIPDRAAQALDQLLPVLETNYHSRKVFELCLLWALEQNREDVLGSLLLTSPWYEAHLLAVLYQTHGVKDGSGSRELHAQFRRIARIVKEPDFVFPSPAEEKLSDENLDVLTDRFILMALPAAGIEWFRQRLNDKRMQRRYKNWECAFALHDADENKKAAWFCLTRVWECTQLLVGNSENKKWILKTKTDVLLRVVRWGKDHGSNQEARQLFRRGWRQTGLSEADVRMQEERFGWGRDEAERDEAERDEAERDEGQTPPIKTEDPIPRSDRKAHPQLTDTEAKEIIQQHFGTFQKIQNCDNLAERAADAREFVGAVQQQKANVSPDGARAIKETIDIAVELSRNPDEDRTQKLIEQLKDILPVLQRERVSTSFPYELKELARTCENVIQKTAIAGGAVANIVIANLEQLNPCISPAIGKPYRTHMMVRLRNPGIEPMEQVEVSFQSASLRFAREPVTIPMLVPNQNCVVGAEVDVPPKVAGDSLQVGVHVTYRVAGIPRTARVIGHIPIRPVGDPIPVGLRYTASSPVKADRIDLFHGRDSELRDLTAAFAGGHLRKLNFVNGIRRVGKSTLMHHLGRKCGPEVLPILLDFETALGKPNMTGPELVQKLANLILQELDESHRLPTLSLQVPTLATFQSGLPWDVFDAFLKELKQQSKCNNLLICFDEVQVLIKRIADSDDPMDDGFLTWLAAQIKSNSSTLVVCTGSEAYGTMRKRYTQHTLWGRMEPYNVSFVSREAMEKIAQEPVRNDGVEWSEEALDRMWDLTEGHPWIIQQLAEKAVQRLNDEERRVAGPMDVEWASEKVAEDPGTSDLWWKEKDNDEKEKEKPMHRRQIAFLVLQQQEKPRHGVSESILADLCQTGGIHDYGPCLDEMKGLELLTVTENEGSKEPVWRIRGGFLERHLRILRERELRIDTRKKVLPSTQECALMLDWENVVISLDELLRKMPKAKSDSMKGRLVPDALALRLAEAAEKHGVLRQKKWAVAYWDRPSFTGHQAALKRSRFHTDMSGTTKADASDHVLRERIHDILRDHTDINVYIIGTGDADFGEVIRTLQEKGKRVVLWATKKATSQVYNHYLQGPDRIQIEWLEDIVFSDTQEAKPAGMTAANPIKPTEMKAPEVLYHPVASVNKAIRFALAPGGAEQWNHDTLEAGKEQNTQLCSWLEVPACDGESAKALLLPTEEGKWEVVPSFKARAITGEILIKTCTRLGVPLHCDSGVTYRLPVQPGFPFLLALADLYDHMKTHPGNLPPEKIMLTQNRGLHRLHLILNPKDEDGNDINIEGFIEKHNSALEDPSQAGRGTCKRLYYLQLAKVALDSRVNKLHPEFLKGVPHGKERVNVQIIPDSPAFIEIRWSTAA